MLNNVVQDFNFTNIELIVAVGFIGVVILTALYIHLKYASNGNTQRSSSFSLLGALFIYVVIAAGLANINMLVLQKVAQDMSAVTIGFIAVILGFSLYCHARFNAAIIHKAPAILTTMGILGTFVGIAVGLAGFDVNHIETSVPTLIDGIKTAFWASAFGILCALTVKLRDLLLDGKRIAYANSGNATINDLAALLKSVQNVLAVAREDSNERLDRLNQSMESLAIQNANTAKALENVVVVLDNLEKDVRGARYDTKSPEGAPLPQKLSDYKMAMEKSQTPIGTVE